MSQQTALLLLGSNLGNKEKNIRDAVKYISAEVGEVVKESSLLKTKPQEFASENEFLNFAVLIHTSLSPISLLKQLKEIEKKIGRVIDSKVTGEYRDRLVDIDIVSFGNLKFICADLEIPHVKHTTLRDFSRILIAELLK